MIRKMTKQSKLDLKKYEERLEMSAQSFHIRNEEDDQTILNLEKKLKEIATSINSRKELVVKSNEKKTSLRNLLTGLVVVCVGQLSADPGTSKSKGNEVLEQEDSLEHDREKSHIEDVEPHDSCVDLETF
ncbi:hypothetical protein Sjap_026162 [Stephania japonica]|uniref:Uncharacterized protein n=1 Tax=Stephania japonica TaxID=461633 RepID=A0AAP0E332_9MAGN